MNKDIKKIIYPLIAAAILIPAFPVIAPATTAPTAIPSGMLWSVTASISI